MRCNMTSDPALAISTEEETTLFTIVISPVSSVDPGTAALVESAIGDRAVHWQAGQAARLLLWSHRNRIHEPSTTCPTSSSDSSRLVRCAL